MILPSFTLHQTNIPPEFHGAGDPQAFPFFGDLLVSGRVFSFLYLLVVPKHQPTNQPTNQRPQGRWLGCRASLGHAANGWEGAVSGDPTGQRGGRWSTGGTMAWVDWYCWWIRNRWGWDLLKFWVVSYRVFLFLHHPNGGCFGMSKNHQQYGIANLCLFIYDITSICSMWWWLSLILFLPQS